MRVASRVALIVLVALVACTAPPAKDDSKGTPSNPVDVCTKEGQSCVFSQGKLGVCTMKLQGCDGGICYTCMSLH